MSYFKISFVSSFLLFLTVVNAQDYFFENYEPRPQEISQPAVSAFLLQNHNNEHLRFRREDDTTRHRRQGGHGGHGGHGGGNGHEGITGPVHTFVKTDEHANFKWGVRHHVGHEYSGRR